MAANLIASVTSVSVPVADSGDYLEVHYTITNNGDATSGFGTIGVYLSTNTTFGDSDDLLLTTYTMWSIFAGSYDSTYASEFLPHSIPSGSYYVFVEADMANDVTESNEADNVSVVGSPAVTLVVNQLPSPDLTISGISIADTTLGAGESTTVTFDYANVGAAAANGYHYVEIYLSLDATIDANDISVGTAYVGQNLASGASFADFVYNLDLPANLADGTYYLGVEADSFGYYDESNESNNTVVASQTITVSTLRPDLGTSGIAIAGGTTLLAGGAVSLTFDLANSGTAASGTFSVGIYLSTDSIITSADTLLLTLTGLSLSAGQTMNDILASIGLPTSLPLGSWYLGTLADSAAAVVESSESNNTASQLVSIVASAPGSDPLFSSQWYIDNPTGVAGGPAGVDLNILPVWADYTGAGVHVAVYDDGFDYTHDDIDGNYDAASHITIGGAVHDPLASGSDAHGQAVMGIIGAERNGIGTIGIAYGATLTGVDIFRVSTFAEEAEALAQQAEFDVVNHSWGYGAFYVSAHDSNFNGFLNALKTSADTGRGGLGTIMVVAGGNERFVGANVTARDLNDSNFENSRYTIAVGAVNAAGFVSDYSTPGAALLVSATSNDTTIGGGVWSTDRTSSPGYSTGSNQSGNLNADLTSTFGGTSAASPMVAGIVALMLEANPDLGWRDVQTILAVSARNTGSAVGAAHSGNEMTDWGWNDAASWNGGGMHFSNDYGFGLVDALAAVRLAETWTAQSTSANEASVFQTVTFGSPLAIPDNNPTGASFTITLTGDIEIESIALDLDFTHAAVADLVITLTAPGDTQSYILNRDVMAFETDIFGGYAGELQVDDWLFTSNAFRGELAAGTWTITVVDQLAVDTGTLYGATLTAYGSGSIADDIYVYTDEFATYAGLAGRATLADSDGGADTLNAAAVSGNAVLDLRAGNASTIAGQTMTIATGTSIENAIAGDGADRLFGNAGANILYGGRGHDYLDGGAAADTLDGGTGNDVLFGGGDGDTFDLGEGHDMVWLDAGDTLTDAGGGNDTVFVLDAAGVSLDVGATHVETVFGGAGADVLDGASATWSLHLSGAAGGDTLTGGNQADHLSGGADADTLIGNGGNDRLYGDAGDDHLWGDADNDSLYGGAGADTFHYTDGFGADTIYDWGFGADLIDLAGVSAFAGTTDWAAFRDAHMQQVGTNVAISAGADILTLAHTDLASLDPGDFLF